MDSRPKVSFVLPVLNGGSLLETCLRSIREQDYPKELVEIVVADGGSTDNTREVCRRFDCVLLDNPRVRAEYGHELAFERATGDVLFIFAADNSLPGKDWISRMVRPFVADSAVVGVYTQIEPAPWDNSFNRYYCLLHVEPFTWFVFGRTVQPKDYEKVYKVVERHEDYVVFDFPLARYPLIAWAQGFALRKGFNRRGETLGDDILPFIQMVEDKCKMAYVPAGVYHHHLAGFVQYCRKYRHRVRNSLYQTDIGFENRARYLSRSRRVRRYLWQVYGCSVVAPVLQGLWWAVRDREPCWLWHGPASVALSYVILYEVVAKGVGMLFRR
jgi:glycosyltransferase involved in cell wall biosynthesis